MVQRPTCEVGNEDDPQPGPEGSFRRRSALALVSPVVESEGGMWLVCKSSGLVGHELGVEVGMGCSLCATREQRTSSCSGSAMCAWNSSVLVTWTAGRGNDRCWRSDLEEQRPLQMSFYARDCLEPHQDNVKTREHVCLPRMPAGTGEEAVEEDLRTLWIDRDDQGQRFKEWKKVSSESSEERQADSPVAGPPCLTVCEQMQHHGAQCGSGCEF